MPVRTVTNYLGPALLALVAALAIANWCLTPAHAPAWAAALVVDACMGVAWFRVSRNSEDREARGKTEGPVRVGVLVAALILLIGLGNRLAMAYGASGSPDFAWRATMAIMGAFLAFTGNMIPKMLTPLAALECDPARAQAARRFAGWTWVLTGSAVCLVWLVLPTARAQTITFIVLPAAMLLTLLQAFLPRMGRKSISPH